MAVRSAVGWKLGTLVQIAAAIGVTVVLLGTIEFACGLFLRAGIGAAPRSAPLAAGTDPVSLTLRRLGANPVPLVSDLDLLWRNAAGAEKTQPVNPRFFGRNDTWTIKNNSEGFRGPERQFKNQNSGVYRILCIGDSVTFGYNVDHDAPYARRLEDALRQQYPSRQFEVINAGVVGWSWVQGLRFLQKEGLALHPNLIIAAHGINDQFWHAKVTDSEHMWLLQNPTIRRMQALNLMLAETNTYRFLFSMMPGQEQQLPISPGCTLQIGETGACHRVSVAEIEGAVHGIHRLAAAAGSDLLVLNLDTLESAAVRGSRTAAQKDGVAFVDFVQRFRELRVKEDWRRAQEFGLSLARLPHSPLANMAVRTEPARDPQILFRVLTTKPGSAMSIKGGQSFSGGFEFDEKMYDDGTHGDEVANDNVFSVKLEVPRAVTALHYRFCQDNVPEFQPLPPYPSSWSDRDIQVGDDSIAFIEVFGERFLMAEGVHPDARGHEVIAAELVEQIERFRSFREFVGTVAGG